MLACAQGAENQQVAAALKIDKDTVGKWRRRFVEHRLAGLRDAPRSGAPRTIDDARIEEVIVKTLESVPEDATHWSSRGMAKASRLSTSSVQPTGQPTRAPPVDRGRSARRRDGGASRRAD
ncbi:MAG: helix-turn-helix domain-containing protein [Reyranella sp.]|nr:helix-turn-helix domain-containing protein [Reyranella sp.]MBN9088407.1 helix-turn-helix domain-containing protein [Reyranella sp.]